jgi:plasmid stabilization system protein ParE
MRVRFEPAARDELDHVLAWIAKDNPRAAFEMVARIEAKVMQLETPELTNMGRPGLVEGTRELLAPSQPAGRPQLRREDGRAARLDRRVPKRAPPLDPPSS